MLLSQVLEYGADFGGESLVWASVGELMFDFDVRVYFGFALCRVVV